MVAWRGVAGDVGSAFNANDLQTWWSVNSCSKALNVVEIYLGDTGTVFAVEAINGKDISEFSVFQNEQEMVLMPGSRLRVKSKALNHRNSLFIVHLEEEKDEEEEEEASGAFGYTHEPSTTNPFNFSFDLYRDNSYGESNARQRPERNNRSNARHKSNAYQTMQQVASTASTAKVELLWESPIPRHLERSINLQCITQRPLKARSLPNAMHYTDSKMIGANNQFLLLCWKDNLHLFDEELKLIKSSAKSPVSSYNLTDIAWCESIQKFIVLTKEHAYVFDPAVTQLPRIESICLRENDGEFVSCTCSTNKSFIATSKTYDTPYLHICKLPSLVFMDRFTVEDLIGSNSESEKKTKYSSNDMKRGKIISVRYNQQRLGMMLKVSAEGFLCTLDLTEQPFKVSQVQLPWYNGRLTVIAKSAEWLVTRDHFEDKFIQIALDCQFKTEWEAKDNSKSTFFSLSTGSVNLRGSVNNVIMLGLSSLVLLLNQSLALYSV